MHLLKLPWLNHNEENRKHEVYSLSVSPDGLRLASGGLDGKVRIWSIADILKYRDESLPRDESCKPLCSMARHNGAVTVVKFSPDGRFLASGSDDKVLLIWEKDEELRPSFGEQNAEHWTVTKRVVAHDNDIQDMAWAPDSSILVTVGLDRSVCIWNGSTFERLRKFDVHQSTVKGVVFDPANKYFATSSDDRSVRIFRYHKGAELSFSIERTVLAPFKKSPLTTYFRRLSWSPDGQHIAVSNATNGPVTSVAIINRGTWDSDFSLIGHETPCEVASFSPLLYEIKKGNEAVLTSVVATGGQDKNLVIWNNSYPIPIVVLEDMTYKTITDIAWTPNGETLFCSSLDGTISAIHFEPGELGKPVSSETTDELLNKYGVDKDSVVFPESTTQLILEEKAAKFQKTLSQKQMDRLFNMEQTSLQRSQLSISKPLTPLPIAAPAQPPPSAPKLISSTTTSQQTEKTKLNQVTISNGKKRVAPTLISTSSHSSHAQDKFKNITVAKSIKESDNKQLISKLSQPKYDLPKFGVQTSVNGYYIKKTSPEDEEEDEGDEIDRYDESDEEEITSKRSKTKKHDGPIVLLHTQLEDTTIVVGTLSQGKNTAILEVLNYYDYEDEDDEAMTIIRGYKNSEQIFETFIDDRIIGVTGGYDKFWALATNSGSLLIYSAAGRILYPKIELCFNISYMTVTRERFLLCVTEDYMIHVYDLESFKKIHKSVSLAPILNYEQSIVERKVQLKSRVLDVEFLNDKIYVTMENDESYLYEPDLKTWVRVFETFYQEFNTFNNIWIDKSAIPLSSEKKPKDANPTEEEKLISFAKNLTFLESYELILKTVGKEYGNITDALQRLQKDPLYLQVRS